MLFQIIIGETLAIYYGIKGFRKFKKMEEEHMRNMEAMKNLTIEEVLEKMRKDGCIKWEELFGE